MKRGGEVVLQSTQKMEADKSIDCMDEEDDLTHLR